MKPSVSYQENLIKELKKDPEMAINYLNASIELGDRVTFLIALRDVIEAYGPIVRVAEKAGIHRVSLQKMLTKTGNPTAESLMSLFRVLGIRLHLEKKSKGNKYLKKAA